MSPLMTASLMSPLRRRILAMVASVYWSMDGVLQGPHDLVEEREIFRLQGIDDHLATGVDSQVAFRLKANERISQRRVADAEFVADGRKIEHAPGQEAPFPHLLPDVLIHHHPSRDGSCFFPGPRRCRLGLLTRMPLCLGKQRRNI